MKWIKNPKWTWRNDLRYYLILPFEIIRMLPSILKGYPAIDDLTWQDYISLAHSFADAKTGRMYTLEAKKQK